MPKKLLVLATAALVLLTVWRRLEVKETLKARVKSLAGSAPGRARGAEPQDLDESVFAAAGNGASRS